MSEFNREDRKILLQTANSSIMHGVKHQRPLELNLTDYDDLLVQKRACFVTLHLNKQLRGCIGSLNASYPLIVDVAINAFHAAFNDSRFHPVTAHEAPHLVIEISVLTVPQPLDVSSEQDLLQKLRPGIDGLILSDHTHRATFLPSVWEQLPNPPDFVIHLKNKAGLPSNYWSNTITFQTYTAELIA